MVDGHKLNDTEGPVFFNDRTELVNFSCWIEKPHLDISRRIVLHILPTGQPTQRTTFGRGLVIDRVSFGEFREIAAMLEFIQYCRGFLLRIKGYHARLYLICWRNHLRCQVCLHVIPPQCDGHHGLHIVIGDAILAQEGRITAGLRNISLKSSHSLAERPSSRVHPGLDLAILAGKPLTDKFVIL